MLTIATLDKELKNLIDGYSVYGAESIINSLVRASKGNPNLDKDMLIKLIDSAYRREVTNGKSSRIK